MIKINWINLFLGTLTLFLFSMVVLTVLMVINQAQEKQRYKCNNLAYYQQLHIANAPKYESAFNQCLANSNTQLDDMNPLVVDECKYTANRLYPLYEWSFDYHYCED